MKTLLIILIIFISKITSAQNNYSKKVAAAKDYYKIAAYFSYNNSDSSILIPIDSLIKNEYYFYPKFVNYTQDSLTEIEVAHSIEKAKIKEDSAWNISSYSYEGTGLGVDCQFNKRTNKFPCDEFFVKLLKGAKTNNSKYYIKIFIHSIKFESSKNQQLIGAPLMYLVCNDKKIIRKHNKAIRKKHK